MANVLIFSGDDMSFYKFRKELIIRLHELGHEVLLVTKFGDYEEKLASLGCRTMNLDELARRGANALQDLALIRAYKRVIRSFRPDVILTYTLKPRVYGNLAAGKKVPIINTITGMGAYTLNGGALAKIATALDKTGLKNANHVFFQNTEAREVYLYRKLLRKNIPTDVVMGSGINLEDFGYIDYPKHDGVHFAFVGRIMKDKGVEELFYAAEHLRKTHGDRVQVHVFGFYEENYKPMIEDLQARGIIHYHGFVSDVRPHLKDMDCVVLPSYHEGVGNAIQEAAASGRPVIASDIPGCRTVVDDGVNGYRCKARDRSSLLKAMEKMVSLTAQQREEMGRLGREKMAREHDRRLIIDRYISVIGDITGHAKSQKGGKKNASALKNLFKKIFSDKEQRHRVIVATTSWIPDKLYLRILYLFICKKWLSFKHPKTFNEKLQWYKLHYRVPLMTQCADKYAVRSYVERKGLGHLLVPLHGVYDEASQIDFSALPEKCILKTTHNSSGSYKWDASRENDEEKIRKCFREMMQINAYWLSREWAYRGITPRIVCEQWIESSTPIVDLKFHCFSGKAQYLCYDVGMNDDMGNHAIGHRAMLDRQLQPLDITTSMQRLPDDKIVLPENMQELLEIADRLSAPFPQVRVDFFLADGKAYFSELTFYSGGGYGTFRPEHWDLELGKHFPLEKAGDSI